VTLEMEDGVDEPAVDAVVAAHVPVVAEVDPLTPEQRAQQDAVDALTDLAAAAAAAGTVVALAAAVAEAVLALQVQAQRLQDHLLTAGDSGG
jgi:hypothetical protein